MLWPSLSRFPLWVGDGNEYKQAQEAVFSYTYHLSVGPPLYPIGKGRQSLVFFRKAITGFKKSRRKGIGRIEPR